ncbi:MAG: glutamate--tRNA ligase [Candidatus Parvarchaeota archaeon]
MVNEIEIEKIAVKNALEHGGKAEGKAVLSKLIGSDRTLLNELDALKRSVEEIVDKVNSMSIDLQMKRADELNINLAGERREETLDLRPLPNVGDKVVLRLPPEPSGYMHLGHAISGMINYLYKERYNGMLWLRFEDTNPNLVKQEFIDSFESGYEWLGIRWDQKKFVSDDMDVIYSYAEKLIKEGVAYVCTCDQGKIKDDRFKGLECRCRSRSIEENISLFNSAKEGGFKPGEATVRLKIDMKSRDFALRDPSIFRVIETGYKPYHLWPLYDFANVVEDYICGVTHVLRSNEFKTTLQDYIRKLLKFEPPQVIQFSRYNFEGTPFSKRKIRALIKEGKIDSWEDIRLPTISAVRRRGIQPEAIKDFTLRSRYSTSSHNYSWDLLLTLNRRILDPKTKRMFFVPSPIALDVEGAEEKDVHLRFHPSEDLGYRVLHVKEKFYVPFDDVNDMKEGERLRLKELYTVKIKNKLKEKVIAEFTSYEHRGDEKIVQWVTDDSVPITILFVGNLLNEDASFNSQSIRTVEGLAEASVNSLEQGDIIQFERFGFCILDKKEERKFIFISR